jgi:predicted transcriptional regulator of viral defense system
MVYNTYQLGNDMNQVNKLTILNNASFFNKTMLAQVMDTNENALSENIKRWLKKGILIRLKNGFYVTKEYYQSIPEKQTYLEFVANILKKPSYLSTEYVLQKYGILSESVFHFHYQKKNQDVYQSDRDLFVFEYQRRFVYRLSNREPECI